MTNTTNPDALACTPLVSPTSLPRPEYPRPQFVRDQWRNLNGPWTFRLDNEGRGHEAGFALSRGFETSILVPFAPESRLSGVGLTDFIEAIWYHRHLAVPGEWAGSRILLHFGGVDYESEIFVDGVSVAHHWGGSSSFEVDLTDRVVPGRVHDLVVWARDDVRSGVQPGGKQSHQRHSHDCFYSRTTGIWQSVWLEPVHPAGLRRCDIVPDLDGERFLFTPVFYQHRIGQQFRISVRDAGGETGVVVGAAANGTTFELRIPSPRVWRPGDPWLYECTFEVLNREGEVIDRVGSYAGMRKVHLEGDIICLNNEPLYLRFVLDQGFYPEGNWTAPSDEALRRDIELAMSCGFNGARLHQKVFEERFHYWADRLGYLTWGESPSWGLDVKSEVAARNFLAEWKEIVRRDRNHPSIIAWTPLNETWDTARPRVSRRLHVDAYELTRAIDPTRPVNDASGGCHVVTDLYTVHIYEQDPAELHRKLKLTAEGTAWQTLGDREAAWAGQPYVVSEFGGIRWIPSGRAPFAGNSWGYGDTPDSVEHFYERLTGQVEAILGCPHIRGYCYTQLTDVEQEENGLFTYEREPKFEVSRLRRIFGSQRE